MREGVELDTPELSLLPNAAIVRVVEERRNREGELRVRITEPTVGWMSRKILSTKPIKSAPPTE